MAVTSEERAILTYLVGELWRRVGDLGQARTWFGKVHEEVADNDDQRWVIAVAEQQRTDPQEWFG